MTISAYLEPKMSFISASVRVLNILTKVNPKAAVYPIQHTRNIHRWVYATLKRIKVRKDQLGPPKPVIRSAFIEWNLNSELFAFSKRLHEEFNPELLHEAFTLRSYIIQEEQKQQELGIENPVTNLKDNSELAAIGNDLLTTYVDMFISSHLPALPRIGILSVRDYLLSDAVLANVSKHIGTKNIILSSEFPPDEVTFAITFKAIVGALSKSSGNERAFNFIRDFVCTQLSQKEIDSIWNIERPIELLQEYCKTNKFGEPEPRLLGDCAKNTITAAYHVGIYCDRRLVGTGFGEDANTAIEVAAINSLKKFYDIANPRPYNFKISLKELEETLQKSRLKKLAVEAV